MSRQQWKILPQSKKTAVFRAFSQKQKIDFWKDKLVETLQLDWTDEEKHHIMQLYNFIVDNPDILKKVECLMKYRINTIYSFMNGKSMRRNI